MKLKKNLLIHSFFAPLVTLSTHMAFAQYYHGHGHSVESNEKAGLYKSKHQPATALPIEYDMNYANLSDADFVEVKEFIKTREEELRAAGVTKIDIANTVNLNGGWLTLNGKHSGPEQIKQQIDRVLKIEKTLKQSSLKFPVAYSYNYAKLSAEEVAQTLQYIKTREEELRAAGVTKIDIANMVYSNGAWLTLDGKYSGPEGVKRQIESFLKKN